MPRFLALVLINEKSLEITFTKTIHLWLQGNLGICIQKQFLGHKLQSLRKWFCSNLVKCRVFGVIKPNFGLFRFSGQPGESNNLNK